MVINFIPQLLIVCPTTTHNMKINILINGNQVNFNVSFAIRKYISFKCYQKPYAIPNI